MVTCKYRQLHVTQCYTEVTLPQYTLNRTSLWPAAAAGAGAGIPRAPLAAGPARQRSIAFFGRLSVADGHIRSYSLSHYETTYNESSATTGRVRCVPDDILRRAPPAKLGELAPETLVKQIGPPPPFLRTTRRHRLWLLGVLIHFL